MQPQHNQYYQALEMFEANDTTIHFTGLLRVSPFQTNLVTSLTPGRHLSNTLEVASEIPINLISTCLL